MPFDNIFGSNFGNIFGNVFESNFGNTEDNLSIQYTTISYLNQSLSTLITTTPAMYATATEGYNAVATGCEISLDNISWGASRTVSPTVNLYIRKMSSDINNTTVVGYVQIGDTAKIRLSIKTIQRALFLKYLDTSNYTNLENYV
jgi:hypothetical protein